MNAKLFTGIGLALALAACASMPQPNAALESARSAVRTAEADPNVNKYAALDLDRARKDLSIAEEANMRLNSCPVASHFFIPSMLSCTSNAAATLLPSACNKLNMLAAFFCINLKTMNIPYPEHQPVSPTWPKPPSPSVQA